MMEKGQINVVAVVAVTQSAAFMTVVHIPIEMQLHTSRTIPKKNVHAELSRPTFHFQAASSLKSIWQQKKATV